MRELIEALQIFQKYGEIEYPFHCEHDILYVNVRHEIVSKEDIEKLEGLGFSIDSVQEIFYSFKYGSC